MRVLVVEDDQQLNAFVRQALLREGFAVDVARHGKEAVMLARENDYDVILLDVMMPELDGYSVLKKMREAGNKAAILMVTCQGQERDKLEGFNSGADDYIVKPFLLTELVARMRAILRRTQGPQESTNTAAVLRAGDLRLDLLKHKVERGGCPVVLTKKEFELLEYFMRHPGRVLSQNVIAQHIWNIDFDPQSNVVEVTINRLRSKLGKKKNKELIQNVRGSGYTFEAQ